MSAPWSPKASTISFHSEENGRRLEELKALGLPFSPPANTGEAAPASSVLKDTVWVLTGTLSQPRETFAERIRAAGGKVTSSISANTTYLLAGESPGSKLDKARKLGIRVLDETGFESLLAGKHRPAVVQRVPRE